MMNEEGLTLPSDIAAERATLGSLMLEPDATAILAPWLKADDFYLERHGAIYAAIIRLYDKRQRPDIVKVQSELRANGQLETAGGMSYIGELMAGVFSAVDVEHYARTVERCAILRRAIQEAGRVQALAYRWADDIDEFAGQAQRTIALATARASTTPVLPIGDIAEQWFRSFQDDAPIGTPTGFYDYDRLTGGLQPGTLVILAARPGVGKSSLAQQIGCNVALKGGRVDIFSIEMGRDQIFTRMVAQVGNIELKAIKERYIKDDPDGLATMIATARRLKDAPIYIDDAPQTMASIRSKALQQAAKHGQPAAIIVDYLQLITFEAGKRQFNRSQEISEIARGLAALSKELQTCVIAISSLNRGVESRPGGKPTMADLKESGDIEYAASIVAFLHREEQYDKATERKGMADLTIAKHRDGPTGDVELRFTGPSTRFDNVDKYHAVAGY